MNTLTTDIVSAENYSFGIPGLDVRMLSRVVPEQGVVLSPLDPYFVFSPICLPGISTRWVREYNLMPWKLKWFYWLPYDEPFDVFEWYPKWNTQSKQYMPLNAAGYPVKLPARSIPEWVQVTKLIFIEMYQRHLPLSDCPPYVLDRI